MNKIHQFFLQQKSNYRKWDFFTFTLLTLLSILNAQITVFYLIYFFWWNELVRIIIDRLYYKRNPNAVFVGDHRDSIFSSFFIMAIYVVFIVVFFGFIAASDNTKLLMVNMKTLFFQNWFFNINLIFVIVEQFFLHHTHQQVEVSFGGFTPNMIILHISIIVGGIVMFFVVKEYPEIFTPQNLWGSVLIVLPFLVLKMALTNFSSNTHQKQ